MRNVLQALSVIRLFFKVLDKNAVAPIHPQRFQQIVRDIDPLGFMGLRMERRWAAPVLKFILPNPTIFATIKRGEFVLAFDDSITNAVSFRQKLASLGIDVPAPSFGFIATNRTNHLFAFGVKLI
jgi:hypothetical protein